MLPFSIRCDLSQGVCVVTSGSSKFTMPSDVVSMVSTGLGVGVLAGILSGVCYVVAQGFIVKRSSRKKRNKWSCEICGTHLQSITSILDGDLVTCSRCHARVCSVKCSSLVQSDSSWLCRNCLKPPESWFKGILRIIQPRSRGTDVLFGSKMSSVDGFNSDAESMRRMEKEQVREFIETLVNVMLGEDVNNASVSMMYDDKQYLPIAGQSPCTAHAALKQLIEKLLREAVNLPLLEKAHAHPASPTEDRTNGSYEDLLATAIINKVISGCQNNLPSSSANSVCSRVSTSSRYKGDKEYFFGEETLDRKWKTTDLDTSSVSSLDDWKQSEASFLSSRKYVDNATLMIKQDVSQVDRYESENEERVDAEYFRSSSSLFGDSESNWFLQKRQFRGSHSPVPVPMLVPNPTTEAKVLIGDKPLDDTSDLSDIGSDYEDPASPHSTHSLLVQSKQIIGGGKMNFDIQENGDEQSDSTDSGVKEVNGKDAFDAADARKTDMSVDDDNIEDSSFLSANSNTEKEAEYTERFASLPKQIMKTSTPSSSYKEIKHENKGSKSEESDDLYESISDFEYVGSYSKKEKEKWKHAIKLENNPYSKENIEKRIKRSNSSSSQIFGSDYYAKLAKSPSGGKKPFSNEINGVSWPPPEAPRTPSPPPEEATPFLQQVSENRSFKLREFNVDEKTVSSKQEVISDGIHQATPAVVTPIHETMIETDVAMFTQEKKAAVYKRGNYTVETRTLDVTSDSDLSYTNFYDVEHAQIVRKTKNEDIHIPIRSAPLGVSYKAITDENENHIVSKDRKHQRDDEDEKTPVPKPRMMGTPNGLYTRATSATKQTNFSATEKPVLRRNLSESNLLDQPSDATLKVVPHKKDNTLISKIYKDPKVRLFALHSREDVLESQRPAAAFQSQRSFDGKAALSENSSLYLTRGRSYHSSEDGLTSEYDSGKTGRMSFFSSDEDVLSLNSEYHNGNYSVQKAELNNSITKSDKDYSGGTPNYAMTPRASTLNKFIYGSQEDLLSIDEVSALPKRKDNTIISKIYQDANVRNFALKTHRDFMPDYQPAASPKPKTAKTSSSDEERHLNETKISRSRDQINVFYNDRSSAEISLESHSHYSIQGSGSLARSEQNRTDAELTENGYNSEDIDIEEVAKRHVVSDTLGKLSQSGVQVRSAFVRSSSLEEGDGVRLSVRDLKKKFENNSTGTKPVISSLTARSLSKQMKESLKQ